MQPAKCSSVRKWSNRFTSQLLAALSALLIFVSPSTAKIGAQYQLQTGNPSGATTNTSDTVNYLIQRDQYALSYNNSTGQPNWVSWDLTAEDIGGSGRSSVFFQDTTLPAGFYQVLTTDYGNSGYDRGHMCPSADRTVSRADNDFTFYMSNMVPQAPDNNQGIWANFENYCRTLAQAGNELLIISGPSSFSGSRVPTGAAAIPGYTWKIVLVVPVGTDSVINRITTSTRVIAIKVPNIAGIRTTPWQNFVTTVAQIQTDTGYTFFSELPSTTAAVLRTVVDGQPVVGIPAIVTQPTGLSAPVGGSAVFSVSATGDAPLSYQWVLDGEDIPGATGTTLNLSGLTLTDMGSYTVRVSNNVGSTISAAANLVVTGVPVAIISQPQSATVSAGSPVGFSVGAIGSPTITYQWRKAGTNILGATYPTLSIPSPQSLDAGSYDVVVSNGVAPTATSSSVTLTVNPAVPSITQQPVSRTIVTGTSTSFTVGVTGSAPITYLWRKGGVELTDGGTVSGATTATLTITNATASDAASYDVVATNDLGVATSSAATLTVNPAPTTATLVWNFGTTVADGNPSGLISGLTGGALSQGNNNGTTTMLVSGSVSSGYTGASGTFNAGAAARTGALNTAATGSAYFEFTLTPAAGKQLSVTNISFGARSTSTGPQAYSVLTSFDNYTTPIATGTIANTSAWALKTNSITGFSGATGSPVTFRIYGHSGTGGASSNTANWRIDDLKLDVGVADAAPTPPALTATTPANNATGVVGSSAITLTFNQAVSVSNAWFSISSAFNGPISATVTGGPTSFTLTPPASFQAGDTITVKTFAAEIRDQATGLVAPLSDQTISFNVLTPQAPSFTTQPQAVTTNAGESATFTVATAGTPPFTYQWRKNGQAISGNATASTASLVLTNVQSADAANYDVLVANGINPDATSNAVALTVTPASPTITTQPSAKVGIVGSSVTFSVAAKGTQPFTYQWRKGGSPLSDGDTISGATTSTLQLSALQLSTAGSYDVVIDNGVGSATTSAAATLIVNPPAENIVTWDFSTATPSAGLPSSLTGGTVTSNNNNGTITMLSTTSASTGYTGSTGTSNAGAAASTGALVSTTPGSAYFEFTLTPMTGARIHLLSLQFGTRSTSTAPQAYAVYTSVDNFAAPLATGTIANNSNWTLMTPTFAGVLLPVSTDLTVRLYGYNGTGSAGANTINWRIDDLKLGVTVQTPPVITGAPSSVAVALDGSTTLSVSASGLAPFTYQWRKNGFPIDQATTSTLTLGNVQPADAANYDVVVTNALGSTTSTAATVTVLTALESWRLQYFGAAANTGNGADTADADGDGIPNLTEYALGLDPTLASASGLPVVGTAGGDWTYTYTRPTSRTDITYTVQVSTDLSTWTDAGVTLSLVSTSGGTATYQATYPQSSASRLFFRLQVSIP